MKLDIISVSNPAYTITIFIIPLSLKNTGHSFKRHPNTQAESRGMSGSSICF
jgi:hypothetical protein